MDIKTREDFINTVMSVISKRADSNIMVLIDSGNGLEVVQNNQSFTTTFGILQAAEKMFDERYRSIMRQLSDEQEKQLAASMMSGIMKGPQGVN